MAMQILRRTGSSGAPASMKSGQLARNENTGILYYGQGNDGNGNATSIVAIGWLAATAAEFLDNTADRVISPATYFAALAHQSVKTFASSMTIDPSAGLSVPIAQATGDFSIDFSPEISDGWTVELRIATDSSARTGQFETGSILMGEAWTGTRQYVFAASSVYLVLVRRAKDNSGTGYNQVQIIKEGA